LIINQIVAKFLTKHFRYLIDEIAPVHADTY